MQMHERASKRGGQAIALPQDPGLTYKGLDQAKKVRAPASVTKIYSSTLQRATQTAEAIIKPPGVKPETHSGLRPWTRTVVDRPLQIVDDPYLKEMLGEFQARVLLFLAWLNAQSYPSKTVLLVGHAHFFETLVWLATAKLRPTMFPGKVYQLDITSGDFKVAE